MPASNLNCFSKFHSVTLQTNRKYVNILDLFDIRDAIKGNLIMKRERSELHICITDGVSKTARFLLYQIARAELFKKKHILKLYLTDAKQHFDTLERIVKEFQLSGISFMKDISYLNIKEAFAIADLLILLHPERGRCGPDPQDYLQPYVEIFKEHGLALALFAKPSARVVVAGDLANTHARVLLEFAKEFPPGNVSAVTRLHANYGRAVLAEKLQVTVPRVRGVLVTGNSTGVQHVDAMHARLAANDGTNECRRVAHQMAHDHQWLRKDFVKLTNNVSVASVNVRLPQNALSVAQATFEHVRELWRGTPQGRVSSAGVYLEQPLAGMQPGVFVSLPVRARGQRWRVDMSIIWELGCMKIKLHEAARQLHAEATTALQILAERKYAKEHPPRKKSSSLLNVSEVGRWLDELIANADLSHEDIPAVEDLATKYLGSAEGSLKSGSKTSIAKSEESFKKVNSPEIKGSRESVKTGNKDPSSKESIGSVGKTQRQEVKAASKDDNSLKSNVEEDSKGSDRSKRSGSIVVRESGENFDRKSRPSVTIVDAREEKTSKEGTPPDKKGSNELLDRLSKASAKVADSKEENQLRESGENVDRKSSVRSRPSVTIVDSREGKMTKTSIESEKRRLPVKIVDSKENAISESAEKLLRASKESVKNTSKTSLKRESSGKLAK